MTHAPRYVVVATLSLLLLGAAVGVAAGSTAASSTSTAPGAAASAQTTFTVDVNHTFQLAPSEPDTVYVDTTIDPADAYTNITFDFSDNNAYYMEETTDFEQNGDQWELEDGVIEANFTVAVHTQNATFSGSNADSALVIFPHNDFASYESDSSVNPTQSVHRSIDGTGVVRDDKALLGSYQTDTATEDGTTIEVVVSDSADLQADPVAVAENVANASTKLNGASDKDVSLLAIPSYIGVAGYGGDTAVAVVDYNALETPDSTWHHEYVHATDEIWKGTEMRWFTEGYAEYEAARLTLEQDLATYQEFREHLEFDHDSFDAATLSDPSTWDGVSSTDLYGQGAIVLGTIDRKVRLASDGQNSLQDVVADMHAHSGAVSRSDFTSFVATHGNQTVANEADTLITTETIPQTWSADAHEEAFGVTVEGPTAQVDVEKTTVNESETLYATGFFSEEGDGEIESYTWDWGDGTTETVSGYNNDHTYGQAGQYTVELTVTDANGRTDTDAVVVTVVSQGDALVVDDYDDQSQWSNNQNDLGYWTGGGNFQSLGVSDGSLSMSYDDGGWFVTNVQEDVGDYSRLEIVIRGASGGEGQDLELDVGNTRDSLASLSGDTVGTDYSTVTVDFADLDFDESSPGEIRIEVPWGSSPSTVDVEEIRFA